MHYAAKTVEYIFKNFWRILLLAIIPAVSLGLFTRPAAIFDYYTNVDYYGAKHDFWEVFVKISFFECVWWKILIGFVALAIITAVSLGIILRHFKVGQFSFGKALTYLNDNIIMVTSVFVVALFAITLAQFLISGIIMFVAVFATSFTQYVVFSVIGIIIVYFLMLILFSIGMMWSAELLETGASFFTGFGLAMRKIRGRVFSLFVGSIIPVSVLFAEACLFAYLNVSFAFVINIVVYLFIYMYYVSFIMVAYYDISGIEREDLKKVNIWKR